MKLVLIATLFVALTLSASAAEKSFSVAQALEDLIEMISISAPRTSTSAAPRTSTSSGPRTSTSAGPRTSTSTAPKSPIATHKSPTNTPKSPISTPKSPISTPKSPTNTPKSPTSTPKSPTSTPKSPSSTPKSPKSPSASTGTHNTHPVTNPVKPTPTPSKPTPTPSPTKPITAPHMYQLDPKWKNEYLGNSKTTIGKAGCAMSSVSAMLAAKGVKINGQDANPHTLNQYLTKNGGYSGDNLNWGAVKGLDFNYKGQISSKDQMISNIKAGNNLILNVGHHWVLATGVTDKGYTVMNPGRMDPNVKNFYTFGEVQKASVYEPSH